MLSACFRSKLLKKEPAFSRFGSCRNRIGLLISVGLLLTVGSFSQNSSYSPDEKKKVIPAGSTVKDTPKVLVIPFEPKLYMSEIDQNVNKETKMNFNQIRYSFRSGLDFSLVTEFKKKYSVTSLMTDTGASAMDQRYIYESVGYKYDLLPDPDNKKQKDTRSDKPKIQNGQLAVTTNDQKKFMNVKITNPNLLSTLNKRYGAEVFVFISELDLKIDAGSNSSYFKGNYGRVANVHYSIYDLKGRLLTAGMATKSFSAADNVPKKIVNNCFADMAQMILDNYLAAISPKPDIEKKDFK